MYSIFGKLLKNLKFVYNCKMNMIKTGKRKDVISSMFFSASIAMIFTMLVGMVASFLDGIITSRYLGADAYSGIALFGPINGVIMMIAAFLSTGSQIIISAYMGEGKKKEANGVLTFTIIIGLFISILFIAVSVLIPEKLLSVCGITSSENPALFDNMSAYFKGFIPAVPALILVQIIGPMVVLDKGKFFFSVSAFVLCVSDVAGDLLNVLYFRKGTFGMGIATSVSVIIQLFMLLFYLFRKKSYFRLSLNSLRPSEIKNLTKSGFPALVQDLAVDLRELSINRINLFFAVSSVALVARGVQYDINQVLFCVSVGIGKTMVTMTGLYYGANDKEGLKRLYSFGIKFSLKLSFLVSAVVFISAPLIVGIYSVNSDAVSLCVFGIRCMSVGLIADVVSCTFINYIQGIRNRKLVVIMSLLDRFVLPVCCALLLSILFGTLGLLISIALGKVVLVMFIFILVLVRNKRFPKEEDGYLFLPEKFGGSNKQNLYGHIFNMDDVINESHSVESFCLEQGADAKSSMRMALFMEEMAGNVVQHSDSRKAEKSGVDYRLYVNDNVICLTLRDYNKVFDPTAWYQENHDIKPGEGTGIRIVMSLAEKTCYFSAFDSNNLIIQLSANN